MDEKRQQIADAIKVKSREMNELLVKANALGLVVGFNIAEVAASDGPSRVTALHADIFMRL